MRKTGEEGERRGRGVKRGERREKGVEEGEGREERKTREKEG